MFCDASDILSRNNYRLVLPSDLFHLNQENKIIKNIYFLLERYIDLLLVIVFYF